MAQLVDRLFWNLKINGSKPVNSTFTDLTSICAAKGWKATEDSVVKSGITEIKLYRLIFATFKCQSGHLDEYIIFICVNGQRLKNNQAI